jgi:hypothetical protein
MQYLLRKPNYNWRTLQLHCKSLQDVPGISWTHCILQEQAEWLNIFLAMWRVEMRGNICMMPNQMFQVSDRLHHAVVSTVQRQEMHHNAVHTSSEKMGKPSNMHTHIQTDINWFLLHTMILDKLNGRMAVNSELTSMYQEAVWKHLDSDSVSPRYCHQYRFERSLTYTESHNLT